MKDELFSDLMGSVAEMVAIEKGDAKPSEDVVHHYETLDVKAIREATGKDRKTFALIIGASPESLKSWENKRRNPSGATKKLLTLIRSNPEQMIKLLETA